MTTPRFSPREFLKGRRPEKFSDTVREVEAALDRSLLEYHLDKLTSRSQEKDFEHFARHLAQKEICPNLLPQTGPTGGGDSKVDSETYPVADDLAYTWFIGDAREAASERWAFAFSAMKEWKPKVGSDVAKIAATSRGYRKAFFVTNQYVRDKVRAEIEDELGKEHGLDVRILDLTWILDKVFAGKHEDLAIEHLRLQTSVRTVDRKGPLDVQRERELEAIESKITEAGERGSFGFTFVDDCIEVTLQARGLDRPRTEVDGRFERARRAAATYGSRHQQLVCAYQQAWTAFWWYEDYPEFIERYREVERLAAKTRNVYELELLTNLWNILYSSARRSDIDAASVDLEDRTRKLESELDRLAAEVDRPSTSLQARSQKLLMQLIISAPNGDEQILRSMRDIIVQSSGLVGFSLEPLVEMLTELGQYIGEQPGYQDLFDTIIETTSKRSEELAAARLLLARGTQQLKADRPVEAIRTLGRALARLYKEESRHELVRALHLCGMAYEKVGLLWAARGATLNAASIATNDFWAYEDVTMQQAAGFSRLKWIELLLGRLPHILAWHELDCAIRERLFEQGYEIAPHHEYNMNFDAGLGTLLLHLDVCHLTRLSRLPDTLDGLGLFNSSVALRFALGHDDGVVEDLKNSGTSREELPAHFRRWRDLPFEVTTPALSLCDESTVTLESNILGCRITAGADNELFCIQIAESLLSALESLLSTGTVDGIIAHEPTLTILVKSSDFCERPFGFAMEDIAGKPRVRVYCPRGGDEASAEFRSATLDKLQDSLIAILARVFMLRDLEQLITKLFRDDQALHRAIDFTSSMTALWNVLGSAPRINMSDWVAEDTHDFPMVRGAVWGDGDTRIPAEATRSDDPVVPGMAAPESFRRSYQEGRIKHTEIENRSLIRVPLWNKAKWLGVAFLHGGSHFDPPILAPIFTDPIAAGEIFAQWREELGEQDSEEKLRVTIVRGISRANRFAYRVLFGSNHHENSSLRRPKLEILVCRIHTMEPETGHNLENFLKGWKAIGRYQLGYCILAGGSSEPQFFTSAMILKSKLNLREAWEIGSNDPDCSAIQDHDDVIIPENCLDAPVVELLQRRQMASSSSATGRPAL